MRALDLFAGAGGASLGLHRAGLELVGAAEWDEHACATHRLALPACPVFEGDVRELVPPGAELWWCSPPCQAWSVGGKRLGARDVERNGWPWVWQAYDRAAVKPDWLIAENVAGMTHHSAELCGNPLTCAGCYLERVVIPELRARFPHVVARVLNAADYGVPQHRRRLFIVCSRTPYSYPAPTHSAPGSLFGKPWRTMGQALSIRAAVLHHGRNTTAHPNQERPRPSTEPAPAINGKGNQLLERSAPCATGRRRLTVAECATLQGFPAWPWQGNLSQQYRQVGNAVPPAMAQALAERCSR